MRLTDIARFYKVLRVVDTGDSTCLVYKGWDCNGTMQAYGWWYRQLDGQAKYLGDDIKNIKEAVGVAETSLV